MPQTSRSRTIITTVALVAVLAKAPSPAKAQTPPSAASPDAIGRLAAIQPAEARTKVLVLATCHLRQVEKEFKPAIVDRLVAALRDFRPDAICVETLPGARVRELDLRRDAGPLYAQVADDFGGAHLKLGKRACEVLGTTPEKAAVKVRELLAARQSENARTSAPDRAALAMWMLAACEPASAVLQWSYLDAAGPGESKPQDRRTHPGCGGASPRRSGARHLWRRPQAVP